MANKPPRKDFSSLDRPLTWEDVFGNKPKPDRKMDISLIIQMSKMGLSYRQMADVLDTTYQVVRNCVYRANRIGAMSGSMDAKTLKRKKVKKLSEKEVNKLATKMEKYMAQTGGMLKEENAGRATAVNVHVGMCIALGAQVDVENINSLYAAFENYLKICAENDVPLTVTSACLACGIKPATLTSWRKGKKNEDYREFAESVTYAVQAGLEAMMAAGVINPVVGIWWEKSHFSMIEANRAEAEDNDPLGTKRSVEDIVAEYDGLELPDE